MLFEDLRLRCWIRRLLRKNRILYFSNAVNLQKQLKKTKDVCICMPRDHKYFYEARDCVSEIKSEGLNVTLVINQAQDVLAEHQGPLVHYPLFTQRPFPVHEEDVSEIPEKFDLVLDLSPQPSALSAYITGTRAKYLSIGIESEKLNAFYTVLIKPCKEYMDTVTTALSVAGLL